jgi:co-chaperonin GroES (HSP10)
MPEMRLCGEYVLLEVLKNNNETSGFKLPETIKMHERFQHSKVVKIGSGKMFSEDKNYNIVCKSGDTVMFRASAAEQIIDPFTQREYLILKNSDIMIVYEGS